MQRFLPVFTLALGLFCLCGCKPFATCDDKPSANEEIQWEYDLDPSGHMKHIMPGKDGGYVIAGGSQSQGWLFRLDSNGLEWWAPLNGTDRYGLTNAHSLGDGTILATSSSYILRINEDGEILWLEPIGEIPGRDSFSELVRYVGISGTGIAVVQKRDSEEFILSRFGIGGNLMWERTFRKPPSVILHDDGELTLIDLEFDTYTYIEHLGVNGNQVWKKSLQIKGCRICMLYDAFALPGGEIAVLWHEVLETQYPYGLTRISSTGEVLWEKEFTYGAGMPPMVKGRSDGTLIVAGNTCKMPERRHDVWVSALSRNGKKKWAKWFGSESSDGPISLHTDENHCIAVVAYTRITPTVGQFYDKYWVFGFSDSDIDCSLQ